MPLGLPQDQSTLDSTPVGTNISDAGARATLVLLEIPRWIPPSSKRE
jgi:hypothetical protein